MATIYSRGKKLWIQYYVDGKKKREALNLEDNRENRVAARRIQKQIEADIDNGVFRIKVKKAIEKKPTLKKGFEEFVKTKENKSKNTRENYENAFDRFFKFTGDKQIREINTELTRKFEKSITYKLIQKKVNAEEDPGVIIRKKLSPNTIECYFRHLRIIFEFFKEKDYISTNPFPVKEKVEKDIIVIPEKEIDDILRRMKEVNREHYKVIQLFLLVGLRATELVKLSFDDIDFNHNCINIYNEKGRRKDKFPLYKKLRDFLLTEWDIREGRLFNYSSRNSLKFFERFLKKEGFKHYSIHTLRKTFLSNLVNSGVSLYDIKTIARHRDIRTTLKFYLSAEMERIGEKINDVVKIGTITGTVSENHLKMVNE